jgi:hypothetical protein
MPRKIVPCCEKLVKSLFRKLWRKSQPFHNPAVFCPQTQTNTEDKKLWQLKTLELAQRVVTPR